MRLSARPIDARTVRGGASYASAHTVFSVCPKIAATPMVRTNVVLPDAFDPVRSMLDPRNARSFDTGSAKSGWRTSRATIDLFGAEKLGRHQPRSSSRQ